MFSKAKSAISSFTSFFSSDENEEDQPTTSHSDNVQSERYENVPWNNERERMEYVRMFKPAR